MIQTKAHGATDSDRSKSSKMSTKPPRIRKHRQKDEMKQEIVPQVHKNVNKEVSPDTENVNKPEGSEEALKQTKRMWRTRMTTTACIHQVGTYRWMEKRKLVLKYLI